MSIVFFRFYEELNDFLPSAKKKITFEYDFAGNQSVKDAIEALGVPHVEVDMILVNGNPVDFTYKLKSDDQVSVYPVFETLDITNVTPLRKKPLRHPKFILDVHLGRLAKHMRLCGLDTFYDKNLEDSSIIETSLKEHRIIITRDRNLLKNKNITHGYWIRSQQPAEQLKEMFNKFDLRRIIKPFTRCIECNGVLVRVDKEDIIDQLLPKTKEYYTEFRKCLVCERIYWEGSHYEKMKKQIDNMLQ